MKYRKRNRWMLFILTAVFCLSGCSLASKDNNSTDSIEQIKDENAGTTVGETSNEKTGTTGGDKSDEETGMIEWDKITEIKIADLCDNMYKEPLNLQLSEEETKSVIETLKEEKAVDASEGIDAVYMMQFCGDNSEVLCEAMVPICEEDILYGTLDFSNGACYARDEQIDTVLRVIEEKYVLSDDLWNRIPGNNYFGRMKDAVAGTLREITDNNFQPAKELELSEEDIQQLAETLAVPELCEESNTQSRDTMKYMLDIYSATGSRLYTLYMTESGEIYTDFGYEIGNEEVQEQIRQMIEKAQVPD